MCRLITIIFALGNLRIQVSISAAFHIKIFISTVTTWSAYTTVTCRWQNRCPLHVSVLEDERGMKACCCAICVTEELDEEICGARFDVKRLQVPTEQA